MQKYRSHKIVEAAQITEFSRTHVDVILNPGAPTQDQAGERIEVPASLFARGAPAIGDYLVRYEDGYLSWSPKAAFEDGYTKVEPTALELGAAVRKLGLTGHERQGTAHDPAATGHEAVGRDGPNVSQPVRGT